MSSRIASATRSRSSRGCCERFLHSITASDAFPLACKKKKKKFFFSFCRRRWRIHTAFPSSFAFLESRLSFSFSPCLSPSLLLAPSSSRERLEQHSSSSRAKPNNRGKLFPPSKNIKDNERRPRRLPQAPPRGGLQGPLLEIRRGVSGESQLATTREGLDFRGKREGLLKTKRTRAKEVVCLIEIEGERGRRRLSPPLVAVPASVYHFCPFGWEEFETFYRTAWRRSRVDCDLECVSSKERQTTKQRKKNSTRSIDRRPRRRPRPSPTTTK